MKNEITRSLKTQFMALIGLIITLVCFYFIARTIDWDEFVNTVIGINKLYLSLGILIFIFSWVLRAIRWQSLLASIGEIPLQECFVYIMVGNLANLILPLRTGEFVRLVFFSREHKTPAGGTLATLILEKVLDLGALLVFVFIVSLAVILPPDWQKGLLLIEGIVLISLAGLIAMAFQRGDLHWLARFIPGFIPIAIKSRLLNLLHTFVEGLAALKNWQQLLWVVIQSIVIWGIVALSLHFFLLAVGIHLAWHAAIFVMVLTNLGTALISTPGGFGIIHFLTIFALDRYGVDESIAFGLAVVFHESIVITQMFVGFISLSVKGIAWRQLRNQEITNRVIEPMESLP